MIKLHDKTFEPYIQEDRIRAEVNRIAAEISRDYRDQKLLLLPLLNGSFVFAADLIREIELNCEISFVKAQSYHGTSSSGKLTELIGLSESLQDRHVLIVEDIIDSGHTLSALIPNILKHNPASLRIASLLLKPAALKVDLKADYVGFEIPNDFIVGYGLDYDGLGRNLRHIYKITN